MDNEVKNQKSYETKRIRKEVEIKEMEILKERENPCLIYDNPVLKKNQQPVAMDRPMTECELARFVQLVEQKSMITAPSRLKDNVLKESKSIGIQMAKHTTKMSVQIQLLLYGLKISAAVVGAIFLLGVINTNNSFDNLNIGVPIQQTEQTQSDSRRNTKSIAETLNQKSNKISRTLDDFSSNLLNWR